MESDIETTIPIVEWEDMAETILSYLLAEESSNPQRIRKGFRKKWAVWDQEKTASLLYPVGRGWRMGRHGRRYGDRAAEEAGWTGTAADEKILERTRKPTFSRGLKAMSLLDDGERVVPLNLIRAPRPDRRRKSSPTRRRLFWISAMTFRNSKMAALERRWSRR